MAQEDRHLLHDLANHLSVILGNVNSLEATPLSAEQRKALREITDAVDESFDLLSPGSRRSISSNLAHIASEFQWQFVVRDDDVTPAASVVDVVRALRLVQESCGHQSPRGLTPLLTYGPSAHQSKRHCSACGEPVPFDCVELTLADSELKIPRDMLPYLFRAQWAATAKLVHRLGGHLIVTSNEEGSRIELLLPILDEAASLRTISDHQILVVDDDPTVARYIASILRDCGYRVEEANTPKAAIDKFTEGEFHLVISDQSMPGMTGEVLIETLRHGSPMLRALICSGSGDSGNTGGEADGYLAKPIDRIQLLGSVVKQLEHLDD